MLAFLITDDELTVIELPDATPENLRLALSELYKWANPDNPHPKPLRDLYSWLVEPLAVYLSTPKVALVPHQELHNMTHPALSDGGSYLAAHSIQVALSQYPLSYPKECNQSGRGNPTRFGLRQSHHGT